MEAMIPTSSAPTTLWEDRYGSLILIMEPQKSQLRSKQLVQISGKIGFGLSPAVIFSSECSGSCMLQNEDSGWDTTPCIVQYSTIFVCVL
uniref:Uncharacterized protein n=1 Tax=Vitis vinifera TaxID=29760 RepID=F6GYI6_VITVI